MPDVLLARYPEGVRPPARLELSGESPWIKPDVEAPEATFTSFAVDWLDADGNIVFHFNPRRERRRVALNSFLDGAWGKELRVRRDPFPRETGRPFRLAFEVLDDRFQVLVDSRRLCEFRHRRPPSTIREVRSTAYFWRLEPEGGRADPPEIVPARSPVSARTWVAAKENPASPEPPESFRLFAVICTWMEEDVIAATVANARLQGCERVYLVDNGSPDRTVERALEAGAILAGRYDQGYFEDVEKTRRLQAVVDAVSPDADAEHVWWLFLDADEFYRGPRGLTLREYLASLDRRFRIVGSRYLNHVPTGAPQYVEGRHPLDFQPLCYEVVGTWCELGHWRHPLQRWDRTGPRVECGPAFHTAVSNDVLLEPPEPVLFHHFPYRAEEATRRRLARLFGLDGASSSRLSHRAVALHMRLRSRSLDAIYGHRFGEVAFYPPCSRGFSPLRPWQEWVEPASREVPRWY